MLSDEEILKKFLDIMYTHSNNEHLIPDKEWFIDEPTPEQKKEIDTTIPDLVIRCTEKPFAVDDYIHIAPFSFFLSEVPKNKKSKNKNKEYVVETIQLDCGPRPTSTHFMVLYIREDPYIFWPKSWMKFLVFFLTRTIEKKKETPTVTSPEAEKSSDLIFLEKLNTYGFNFPEPKASLDILF